MAASGTRRWRRYADRAQPVRARAVSRPDARLQGPRHAGRGAAHEPCTLLRTGAARRWSAPPPATPAPRQSRPFAARARRHLHLLPRGSGERRAAAADDDGDGTERAQHRREGTFDDCQALVKALFNDHALRDSLACRRQLDQLGPHPRPGHLLLHRGDRARCASPRRRLRRTDRKFRRYFRGLRGKAHGLTGRAPRYRHEPQRQSTACVALGGLRAARGDRHYLARDGHPDCHQFRASPVRASGRDAAFIRAKTGAFGRKAARAGPLKGTCAVFRRRIRERARRVEDHRAPEETGYRGPAHRLRRGRGRTGDRDRGPTPQIVLSTAHPAKFPERSRRAPASGPHSPSGYGAGSQRTSASPPSITSSPISRAPRRDHDARDARGPRMTPTVTTLANGLRVVTRRCRTWRPCRWGCGWARAPPRERARAWGRAFSRAYGLQRDEAA